MIKNILVIGDSFSFGSELPDVPPIQHIFDKDKTPSKFAWPALLGESIGAQVTNLSLPGGSNDRIFRLIVDKSIKDTYDLVICAWTDIARLDLQIQGIDVGTTIQSKWAEQTEWAWVKNYFAQAYNDKQSYQRWLVQLITLQNHFKYTNQKYIFVGMKNYLFTNDEASDFAHLIELIDTKYYLGWPNQAFVTWMGDCPKGPRGHPLELGQKRIAEKINEYIRNLGWVS